MKALTERWKPIALLLCLLLLALALTTFKTRLAPQTSPFERLGCMPRFRRAGAFGFASCSHRFFLGFFLTWVFSSAFSSQIANAPGLGHTQSPPRRDGRARATPENHQIKFFRLRLLNYLSG